MKFPRIGILIQARSNSTRFPRKIYQGIPDEQSFSLLEHVYRRLSRIDSNFPTVLLVPSKDQELIQWCEDRSIAFFHGSEKDVRQRYRQAASHWNLDIIVRATADNPCVDPEVASQTISALIAGGGDFLSFSGLPLGTAVEAFRFDALMKTPLPDSPSYKEHVSLHIKRNPHLFDLRCPGHPFGATLPFSESPRLTIDTWEDWKVVSSVFSYLGPDFTLMQLLTLYQYCPELFMANQNIRQKPVSIAS